MDKRTFLSNFENSVRQKKTLFYYTATEKGQEKEVGEVQNADQIEEQQMQQQTIWKPTFSHITHRMHFSVYILILSQISN